MSEYIFPPAQRVTLPVENREERVPVRRVYCIGRNYAAHTVEMGGDPDREEPFFFHKVPEALDTDGEFPYPPGSEDVHHEIELAAILRGGGRDIEVDEAMSLVWGYAVALDMTRRDLQGTAKKAGRPWEIGKSFEGAAPIGLVVPAADAGDMTAADITLSVNGELRQSGNTGQMIWKLPEIISYLSRYFSLAAGDVILTGTPSGVGPVARGDVLHGEIGGLPPLDVRVV